MAGNVHDGHRQRMRERIKANGLDGLQDHEVLEYLLFGFIPRRDTNELAHRLLGEFGSLANVLNADVSHLADVSGMTENAALFLSVLPDVFRKYLRDLRTDSIRLSTRGEVSDYLGRYFVGLDEERVYAVALDIHDDLIACELIASGSRAQVDLKPAKIVDFAKKHKAVGVVIAHNHPGGSENPSNDDICLTREIFTLLDMMGYKLHDHLIFNNTEHSYSFEEHGYIKTMTQEITSFKESLWRKN